MKEWVIGNIHGDTFYVTGALEELVGFGFESGNGGVIYGATVDPRLALRIARGLIREAERALATKQAKGVSVAVTPTTTASNPAIDFATLAPDPLTGMTTWVP